ncbi:hypothetical protein J6590_000267 [Homalodisca vitripennis]|nr:hypothetical protein J6590_000267 [Homalodisca vitripennis]
MHLILKGVLRTPEAHHVADQSTVSAVLQTAKNNQSGPQEEIRHPCLDYQTWRTAPLLLQGSQRAGVQQFPPAHYTFYRADPDSVKILPQEKAFCSFSDPDAASTFSHVQCEPILRQPQRNATEWLRTIILDTEPKLARTLGGRGLFLSIQTSLADIRILKGTNPGKRNHLREAVPCQPCLCLQPLSQARHQRSTKQTLMLYTQLAQFLTTKLAQSVLFIVTVHFTLVKHPALQQIAHGLSTLHLSSIPSK